jgi:hypothetical protein
MGRGVEHHNWGKGLTEGDVWAAFQGYIDNYKIVDISKIIQQLKQMSKLSPLP